MSNISQTVYYPSRILNRNVGGNSTYTQAIAQGVQDKGWKVKTLPSGPHPAITAAAEQIPCLPFGLSRIDGIVHYSADTGPLAPVHVPSVVTVHGVASAVNEGIRTPTAEKIWRYRVKSAIKFCDEIITVSHSSARTLESAFGLNKSDITVIPHGIDVDHFAQKQAPSEEIKGRLPNEYILYLGNLEPRKNIIELVDAIDKLNESGFSCPLVVAGKPRWSSDDIMAKVNNSPNVIYLGFVSDQDRVALLQDCTAFIFPSLYEGFGFPVLEAMAAGSPVLCTDRGSLSEVAGPAKIIPGVGSEEIASTIESALGDKKWLNDVVPEGRSWASKFDWSVSVDRHLEIYSAIAAR